MTVDVSSVGPASVDTKFLQTTVGSLQIVVEMQQSLMVTAQVGASTSNRNCSRHHAASAASADC